jgi:hypothetical protein
MSAPPGVPTTRCKTCGKTMAFAKTPEGKTIPLDVVAPVYRLSSGPGGQLRAERAGDCFVSHFATCPQASSHSRKPEASS